MAVLIHNKVASPVTLPFPYGAILVGGGSVVVPGTPDSVRANFGDLAQATTVLDFRQVDDSQISISPNAVISAAGGSAPYTHAASPRDLQATTIQTAITELVNGLLNASETGANQAADLFINTLLMNNEITGVFLQGKTSALTPPHSGGVGEPIEIDGGSGTEADDTFDAGPGGDALLIGGGAGTPSVGRPTVANGGNAVVDGGSDNSVGDNNGAVLIGGTNANQVDIGRTGKPVSILGVLTLGAITITTGTGSPEGAVTANPGSLYTDGNGGAGVTLYVKESGAGNTGWVAK